MVFLYTQVDLQISEWAPWSGSIEKSTRGRVTHFSLALSSVQV